MGILFKSSPSSKIPLNKQKIHLNNFREKNIKDLTVSYKLILIVHCVCVCVCVLSQSLTVIGIEKALNKCLMEEGMLRNK